MQSALNVFYCYLRTKWKPIKYRKCVVYRKYFMRFFDASYWICKLQAGNNRWNIFSQNLLIIYKQTNKNRIQPFLMEKCQLGNSFEKGTFVQTTWKCACFTFDGYFLLLLLLFLFCIKIAVSHQRVSSSISKSFELFASYVYIFFVCLCLLDIFIFAICKLKFVMWWLRRMI